MSAKTKKPSPKKLTTPQEVDANEPWEVTEARLAAAQDAEERRERAGR